MGIEPTSEAWDALNKTLKAIDLAARLFGWAAFEFLAQPIEIYFAYVIHDARLTIGSSSRDGILDDLVEFSNDARDVR